ncbi:hypothetical protein X797_011028 [Metarhizium robertsii]|uniref:BTB domain-containing protein n=1 Tax=Metarhizium robertsii TaxID=568076 RepID=A0A014QSV1_9HYPO|nr:hypothetical protein X797_011028 [Metarhizium robertsii]
MVCPSETTGSHTKQTAPPRKKEDLLQQRTSNSATAPKKITSMNSAIAASEPYTFIVGPDSRKFTIHSALVAKLSPCLERLVNGPMREGLEKSVTWDSVDAVTFGCFFQYAYTGSYDVRKEQQLAALKVEIRDKAIDLEWPDTPTDGTGTQAVEPVDYGLDEPVDSVQTMAEPEPEPPAEDDYRPTRVKKGKKKKGRYESPEPSSELEEPPSKQETLWAKFVALRRTSVSLNAVAGAEEVPAETEDLVSHAKVYVFADYHGIDKLTTISYNNLHRSLIDLNLQAKTLAGVIALFQYSYETLVPDDLRDLSTFRRLRSRKTVESPGVPGSTGQPC